MHKFAETAAIAAMAAGRQDKFWQMHDMLFANHNRLNEEKVKEFAAKLELDKEKFAEDRKDPALRIRVFKDFQNGFAAGVRGTPALFVNGRRVKGRSMAGISKLIDTELKKIKQN